MPLDGFLTEQNIRTGYLTDEQLTAFAGFPVKTALLSSLPYWDILKAHANLPDEVRATRFTKELGERSRAVYTLLENAGFSTFTRKDARAFAGARYPLLRSTIRTVDAPAGMFDYFYDVQEKGIEKIIDNVPGRDWPNSDRPKPYVFQGAYSEPVRVSTKKGIKRIYKQYAAFMLLNGDADGFEKLWANELGLPVEYVQKFPDIRVHTLIGNLHEMWHLPQITFIPHRDAANFNNYIARYYEETAADMGAHSILRRVDFGHKEKIEEALLMDRHKRYMGLLFNSPPYWFAPFLDALEKRETPPDFYQVHQSVMEIRLRLLIAADKLLRAQQGLPPPAPITSKELNEAVAGWRRYPGAQPFVPEQPKKIAGVDLRSDRMMEIGLYKGKTLVDIQPGLDNLYLTWRETQFYEKPEIFYTLLRQSWNEGAFAGNRLTWKIAAKMIEAAEFFNPALTREPQERLNPVLSYALPVLKAA